MNTPVPATLQSRLEAARRQLAWLQLDTLVQCVKDAKEGLAREEGFVVELCALWRSLDTDRTVEEVQANARALMLLARHGG